MRAYSYTHKLPSSSLSTQHMAYHHHQLHPRHPGTPAANLREILQTNDLNGAKEYIVEGTPEKGPVTSGMGKCMEMS